MISKNTTTTAATIAPAMASPFRLLHYERCRAPDLNNLHARALLDLIILVEGARGPHLTFDLDASHALVVGDPLEHDRLLADQRRGAGPDLWRHLHVRTRDRPDHPERQQR